MSRNSTVVCRRSASFGGRPRGESPAAGAPRRSGRASRSLLRGPRPISSSPASSTSERTSTPTSCAAGVSAGSSSPNSASRLCCSVTESPSPRTPVQRPPAPSPDRGSRRDGGPQREPRISARAMAMALGWMVLPVARHARLRAAGGPGREEDQRGPAVARGPAAPRRDGSTRGGTARARLSFAGARPGRVRRRERAGIRCSGTSWRSACGSAFDSTVIREETLFGLRAPLEAGRGPRPPRTLLDRRCRQHFRMKAAN